MKRVALVVALMVAGCAGSTGTGSTSGSGSTGGSGGSTGGLPGNSLSGDLAFTVRSAVNFSDSYPDGGLRTVSATLYEAEIGPNCVYPDGGHGGVGRNLGFTVQSGNFPFTSGQTYAQPLTTCTLTGVPVGCGFGNRASTCSVTLNSVRTETVQGTFSAKFDVGCDGGGSLLTGNFELHQNAACP